MRFNVWLLANLGNACLPFSLDSELVFENRFFHWGCEAPLYMKNHHTYISYWIWHIYCRLIVERKYSLYLEQKSLREIVYGKWLFWDERLVWWIYNKWNCWFASLLRLWRSGGTYIAIVLFNRKAKIFDLIEMWTVFSLYLRELFLKGWPKATI